MKTLVIEISEEFEQQLAEQANKQNLSLQDFVLNSLTHTLQKVQVRAEQLDRIERNHPAYEPVISAILQQALNEPNNNPAMNSDEFRDWLTISF